ncbi:MAG: OsmC family protein [Steroidobacteraceae bacterium]
MSDYSMELVWERGEQPFVDMRYSRRHRIRLDGGLEITGSSSPGEVPEPMSDPAAIDPEEAFISALSSCHMLWFLALAGKQGYRVDRYIDRPSGLLARGADGRKSVTVVTLRPQVKFSGERVPDEVAFKALHHDAHSLCYIANSVKSEVRVEPQR